MINFRLLSLLVVISLIIFTSSCEKFKGELEEPAYLSIDSIYLTTNYQEQGTASHRITDAWVYVDDEFLGAYELPARLPVLQKGKHRVKIWPGVKKNGISATRVNYYFYNPIEQTVEFTPDSTASLGNIQTTYQASASFLWKEDFDNITVTLDTTPRSSAWIRLTQVPDSIFEGTHSCKVVLDNTHDFFEAQSHAEYPIPAAPVYLELNFNINHPITVGVVTYGITSLYQTPVMTLNPTNGEWKKIYIDLTTTLNAYLGMKTFRVYVGTFKSAGVAEGVLLFDNFKILTRK